MIVWTVAKFRPYLMAMPFEVYTDHYALQWLKTMRTGSALLHRWSAALEEYDFTVHHRPGKIQTHVDGLSRLPVGPAPPEDALLHIQVDSEEEARKLAQELHSSTHLGWSPSLHRGRTELPTMSAWERLRSLFEDNRVHTVQRAVGHALGGHCGSTPCLSPT